MKSFFPRSRLVAGVLLFAICVAALLLMNVPPARAHAIVERTEPRADQVVATSPERVRVFFSEPVEVAFGAIRVYDTNGRRVDTGETEHLPGRPDAIEVGLQAGLPRGTYTVTWRVVSADSHPVSEAFVWHLGKPGPNPLGIADELLSGGGAGRLGGVLLGVTRWASFGALLVLMGAVLFLALVWSRAPAEYPGVQERFRARWRRTAVVSWSILLLATLASMPLQAAVAGGLPLDDALSPGILGEVLATRFGRVALAKLALLGAAAPLALTGRLETRQSGSRTPRWTFVMGAALLAGLALTPGLQGHAGTTHPVGLSLAADGLHLLALATWIGGLALLVVAAWPATRSLANADRVAALAPVVARFSNVAVVAVAAVVVTGTCQAFLEIGAWRALTSTTYGWTFLAKMSVFLPLLALGVVNNRRSVPALQRAAGEGDVSRTPLTRLGRLIVVETVLAAVVLAVTAGLVNLPPARVAAGIEGPLITDVPLGGARLEVLVDPNRVGANEVHLTATTPRGEPLRIRHMEVLFSLPSEELGPIAAEGRRLAPGHFVVQGNQLSVPGTWKLEVVARSDRFTEQRAVVEIVVNQ